MGAKVAQVNIVISKRFLQESASHQGAVQIGCDHGVCTLFSSVLKLCPTTSSNNGNTVLMDIACAYQV